MTAIATPPAVVSPGVIAVDGRAFSSIADALAHAKILSDHVGVRKSQLVKARLRLGYFLLDLRSVVGLGHWEDTLQAAGIPIHTARRAMRLARAVRGTRTDSGPVADTDLDDRTLVSVEIELGIRDDPGSRQSPAVVILDRIDPALEFAGVTPRHTILPGVLPVLARIEPQPAPSLAGPALTEAFRQSVEVLGGHEQPDGQRLLSELYDAVERVRAEINRALGVVAGLDSTKAVEVRVLLTTIAHQLGELSPAQETIA